MPHHTQAHTVERLRAEFLEMPGLRLTMDQAHRFCGVERRRCSEALDLLVREQFLSIRSDGSYVRASEGRVPRPRPAKAGVDSYPALDFTVPKRNAS